MKVISLNSVKVQLRHSLPQWTRSIFHVETLTPDAIARAMPYAIEQPAEVDVNEIMVRPTAGAQEFHCVRSHYEMVSQRDYHMNDQGSRCKTNESHDAQLQSARWDHLDLVTHEFACQLCGLLSVQRIPRVEVSKRLPQPAATKRPSE